MKDQIAYHQMEIRFLRHFMRVIDLMIQGREENIALLKADALPSTQKWRGGEARSKALSPERRSEIAKKAAQARWGKK